MQSLKFTAEILLRGVNPYVLISELQAACLKAGWRRPMPVLLRVNGQPREAWPINMMPVGNGDFYLYLHGDVRRASQTQVGDIVAVEVRFDNSYTSGPEKLPDWFVEALSVNKPATNNWEKLPPSRQKEVVRSLLRLKSAEAQARNLTLLLEVLSGQDGVFMGRRWHNGA